MREIQNPGRGSSSLRKVVTDWATDSAHPVTWTLTEVSCGQGPCHPSETGLQQLELQASAPSSTPTPSLPTMCMGLHTDGCPPLIPATCEEESASEGEANKEGGFL